uniref:Genome polyprotein n=1 Tax=Rousettus madagascariensis picornavirus TaxID=3044253 RepID=A0AA49FPM4_9VIRU|nr:MAG: polyprotein [Rousettus madagascariensis picornavirus]
MAIKSVFERPVCELFLSKIGSARSFIHVFGTSKLAWVVKTKLVKGSNQETRETLRQCGVAASKSDVGDRHELNSSGGNITMINYYGAQYAQSHANPSLQMDPEKFTKPITDLAAMEAGPALKSPTVEEAGYSDRIMQLTAGNSMITTQEGAQAVVGYGVWPDYDPGVGNAIDAESKPGPAVERFYTLDSQQWNTNSPGWFYRLPGCLAHMGMFGQNLQYHFLSRSGYAVHVQVNASKFHQGCLLVVMIPECVMYNNPSMGKADFGNFTPTKEELRNLPTAQMTIFPHQLINLRTNNSATIIMPYTNSTPAENGLTHNPVTLVIIPVVDLKYSTGATPSIPITVSIAPMFASFSGLRNPVMRQGVPVFEVPGSGQFMTTLKNQGYPALPEFEETPCHNIPGEVTNLMEVAQVDTFMYLGTSGLHLSFDVSQQTQFGGLIKTIDLSLTSDAFGSTYLARLARWFTHYRGSINITFLFAGSAMATGKFLIAYTPPGGSAPKTRTDAMLATHYVWDIGLQSSITINIPFISQSQYRYNNVDGNVFSYDGYLTIFYQTNIVVPADTPTTCSILGMMSASKDFAFRLATDNAYFQGLGEDLGKLVSGSVQTITESVLAPATGTSTTVPQHLSVHSGEAAALTAPETGASSTVEAPMVLETRSVPFEYSKKETDINIFMSRYAKFAEIDLKGGTSSSSGGEYAVLDIKFSDTATTHQAVRAKYAMFTYLRMGFDIVAIVSPKGNGKTNNRPSTYQAPKFQILYVPVGAPAPDSLTSDAWYATTSPSIYFSVQGPPPSLRLPFVGMASVFSTAHDGWPTFTRDPNTGYGDFPGNTIGKLAVRLVTDGVNGDSDETRYRLLFFARPTAIRAFIPRPIVTRKNEVAVASYTRNRSICVNTDSNTKLLIGQTPIGADLKVDTTQTTNTGPSKRGKHQKKLRSLPAEFKELIHKTYLARDIEDGYTFHIFPLNPTQALLPAHLSFTPLSFGRYGTELYDVIPYRLARVDPEYDLTLIETEQPYFDCSIAICPCTHGKLAVVCDNSEWSWWRPVSELGFKDEIHVDNPVPHKQRHLFRVGFPIQMGVCGSPLLCEHGFKGMASVSSDYFSYYTSLMRVPWITGEPEPMEQGPVSWAEGVVEQFGAAFGNGLSGSVLNGLSTTMSEYANKIQDDIGKKIISCIVKAICGCVLIVKAEDKLSACTAVGVMLGIDIFLQSPFDWLQNKICSLLGMAYAVQQGVSDWIKEFNAACTAAKGLEWIGQKISEFITWLQKLFKKEDAERTAFMDELKNLPQMMIDIDKIQANRGKYRTEDVRDICDRMTRLKNGADVYGVERNQATTQIVKYYQKVKAIEQSITPGRFEPVAMLIHGSPGCGKSLATEIVGRCLSEKLGSGRPYSLPPDPKHFDGYAQQPVVLMDDVGQNPDGEDLKLFCQMVSTTEFVVPMAALEEKGMPFSSEFVLCSTNCSVLTPPTVSEPAALARRFFLDLFVELDKDYTVSGKLDANQALNQCTHASVNFKHCCPFICGKAIRFKNMTSLKTYSLDEVVTALLMERQRRMMCGDKLQALFQGPPTPYNPIQSIEERAATPLIVQKPLPKDMADLLRALPRPEIIQYCEEKGWIVPSEHYVERTRADVKLWVKQLAYGLSILSSVLAVGGFIYMLYKIFASNQGPYEGLPHAELKRPTVRKQVVTQGPDVEFASKLLNQSLFDVVTSKGSFTGLGIYDTWVLLPKHSLPGETIMLDGLTHKVLDAVDLESPQGSLELTAIKLERPTKFRDVRKFFPERFTTEPECLLVLNNSSFKRMTIPVGRTTAFGFLNLSCKPTYNTCTYPYPTRSGQCGGVICKSGKIIAMHIGGDGVNGYGAILTNSMFSTLEQGQITKMVKTPFKPINVNSKSRLQPSVFYNTFPGSKEPAALNQKDPRLVVDLDEAMFAKHKGNVNIPIPDKMSAAIQQYVAQIRPVLPPNLTDPLPLEDVVHGVANLDALDLNTSAGYPYVLLGIKKKDLIGTREEPLTELQRALDLHGYDHPFITYLKDELRPIEKVRQGKTRLIECSSLNDTIRMKSTFGRLFQCFHANPGTVTGSAVGCDPDVDWSRFYAEMGGLPLIAFDYSNYDASLGGVMFSALKKFLTELGYDAEQLKCIDHIQNTTHLYRDKYYTVEGGMPSGCSGTSIFNSIINNIIIKTLALEVYKGIDLDQLRIIAYGDDVVATYPFPLDASLLAEQGKNYGLTMTPPDKSSDFNDTTWDTVTFLKRKFVPDKQFPFLIHPVFPMSEIYESIRWTRAPAYTQEHVTSLCHLAWHNGEEVYNKFLQTIKTVPLGRALTLPPYAVLRLAWLDKF